MANKHPQPPLHTTKLLRRATFNRLFMAVYTAALLALFYHHAQSTTGLGLGLGLGPLPLILSLLFIISDLILGFTWACSQAFHVRPIRRLEFPENLGKDLPAVDIFICTADPYKEPPVGTVNTAISAMAYDYSPEKLSVYISDDGGSQLTLFAFMEAAKFARHWLPFCRDYHVIDRCPEAYFNGSSYLASTPSPLADKLKIMYENMKMRVEMVIQKGKIMEEYVDDQLMRNALARWTSAFSRQNHPAIIQVLLTSIGDKDIGGQSMPNLIYVSREKSRTQPHHFKAGALNALVRVSATMTNAPIVLTLDCDTYSNDPQTVKRALCYFCDPLTRPTLAYVQFPQIFRGLNTGDIYFGEHKRLFQINPMGMDGLLGPNYVGANCFFQRRAFFGSPSLFIKPEPHELSPDHIVGKPIGSTEILNLAHHVAACNFEEKTEWGSKIMYENMKMRVEMVVENGKIIEEYVDDQHMRNALAKWTPAFSRQNHPAIIQVLLTSNGDKDINGQSMPNLIYVSREKCITQPHHFKAGALNALLRVSATMTNAPIVLTLDCDTYSNDPQTVKRALCYFCDPLTTPTLAYVQFPQIFRGLNKGDIYFCENKRLYQINPMGMDGLLGPNNVGTNCFFQRRAFFGSPSLFVKPEPNELSPDYTVGKPIGSPDVLKLAHHVAACNFEEKTDWGSKLGYRYGSLVEDYYTGYRMKCEGWRSIFAHPERPAFLGDSPITLIDLLGQCKRWMVGLLEVLCSRYSTITFGVRKMGLFMGFAYTHCAYWPILSIPLTFYAFIPQLALLNGVSIFPKVTDPCFVLYIFLFIGAYAKDLLDFLLERGTFERWWNSQRMWMICGLSSFLFGTIEYILGILGVTARGFDVTNKQQDDELSKRYDQGIYEFGVTSTMFVPLTMAAIINLVSFVVGLTGMFTKGIAHLDGLVIQILLSGFGVVNSWPLYEAMAFRSDRGRMPSKVIFVAGLMVSILCIVGHSIF